MTAGDTPKSRDGREWLCHSRPSLFGTGCVRPSRYHEGSESRRLGSSKTPSTLWEDAWQ